MVHHKKDPVRELAAEVLQRMEGRQVKPARIIEKLSRNLALSVRERRFLSNLVYGVLRHRRLIDYSLDHYLEHSGRLPSPIRQILRLGAYQLLLCDRIPDRAAVHSAVELAGADFGRSMASLTNAVLRKVQAKGRDELLAGISGETVARLAIGYSFPDWMVRRWHDRFGPMETEMLLEAMNTHPPLNLRVNDLVTTRKELARDLEGGGLASRPCRYSGKGLILDSDRELSRIPAFFAGSFSVQDEAFQLIGSILPILSGEAVLDLFAGYGGKSTLLSQKAGDSIRLVAADNNPSKLASLVDESRRLKIRNIFPVAAQADSLPFREGSLDALLLDVPCSGTGIIRRHPDIKWNRREADLKKLAGQQARFLASASRLVKKGGYLLYATCSLEPEENEEVVMSFLENYGRFHLVKPEGIHDYEELFSGEGFFRSFPHRHGLDGSFAALLIRR